ncbi:hypothetical protein CANCADRAFT_32766 [Tortispora caseinolytica NRRL Y-17796]|uniref:Extradiol ring-cleavage dioxygenase class III enzyme subunit B domain-containing protein n=1 Tax=Tortispora caseinolytica NRRL Y-17796 TaxID=767744 RepID=A0A1E4TCR0_9ASCO|nr:hypothetical protein CANCADRAFT_32766 [Tortispora caseinolytica NRRL Y-17796]
MWSWISVGLATGAPFLAKYFSTTTTSMISKTPVYFFSHGGPTFMYRDQGEPGAYDAVQKLGDEIVNLKPKAIVVVSAHWQERTISVTSDANNSLIYDFYGFPDFMYHEKFPTKGSPELANHIVQMLKDKGLKAETVQKRGIDHGVWVPFRVAFGSETKLKDTPLIQVSLPYNESPAYSIELGRALAKLREENIIIIGSGMTVHNLRDMHLAGLYGPPLPYAKSFDKALELAVTTHTGKERETAMEKLFERADRIKAHPTAEHLLPIYVSAGAAYEDIGTLIYTRQISSLGWGIYKFTS